MNNDKKQPDYLLAIFIVAELVFFIAACIIIPNLFTNNDITTSSTALPTATITGLPPFISEADSKTIGRTLYDLMLQNTDNKQLLNQDASATINSEATYHFPNQAITLFSATVNAPKLNQSYKLFYGYGDEGNDSYQQFYELLCIEAPTTPCTSSSDYIESSIARNFLPYIDFDKFTIYLHDDEPQTININPITPTNGNQDIEKSYINEVKSALNTLGLSPDSFTYRILTPADYTYIIAN